MIPRRAEAYLTSVYDHFPILFLTGPRQSGKTTLAKVLYKNLPYVLLELPDQQQLAQEDPRSFLKQFHKGAILDEVQNVPVLFSYLQGLVDDNRELRFILTGSQNFLLNEKITQSLAGRAGIVTLLPLSLQELTDQISKSNYEDWIVRGFYPELYNRNIPFGLFYPAYVQTYLERDVRSLKNVGSLTQFNVFLKLCAGRVGQLLNVSALATDAGISVNTCKAWLSVLEASYIIYRLQPYYKNFNKRLIKSPKLYFTDTGLVCHLLGIEQASQLSTHYARGSLFENFVIMDCYKQRLARGKHEGMYFWRDHKGLEVDLIIEDGQTLKAYEIKAGRTANASFFTNLMAWEKLSGSAIESTVIYGGDISQQVQNVSLKGWREMVNGF
ncbi:MAG: ATP-binding protein [Bacteroidota bacterium]